MQKYYEKETAIKGPFMPPTAKIFFWWCKIKEMNDNLWFKQKKIFYNFCFFISILEKIMH